MDEQTPNRILAMSAKSYSEDQVLERELNWLAQVIDARFKLYFQLETEWKSIRDLKPPRWEKGSTPSEYRKLVEQNGFGYEERIIFITALVPHLRPQLLDIFYTRNSNFDRSYTEFGGQTGKSHGGFLPTGETLLFVLAGEDLALRQQVLQLLGKQAPLSQLDLIQLKAVEAGEPALSGVIQPGRDILQLLTTGSVKEPTPGAFFPAQRISTKLEWEDLVLQTHILEEIEEVRTWIDHQAELMSDWGIAKMLKPGYRALFYGPPGTGKTLTATLLGKVTGLDVYRVDLSMVVSKYIGETEKNLAQVFDQAERKNWILFFDEADALFGKRTSTSSSNDRYANQETAYLLQRVEDYPGVAILASNLRNNLDDAFSRRFQSMVYFPMPRPEERYRLWEKAFSGKCRAGPDLDLISLSREHELAGGAIINVLRTCVLGAVRDGKTEVSKADVLHGVRKELRKENKTI